MKLYRQDSGGHLYAARYDERAVKLGIQFWVKYADVRRLTWVYCALIILTAALSYTIGALS